MSIELIDPKGSEGFQINAGLRIRGGASRDPGNPKHSLQVRMRSSYGAPALEYPLFGTEGAQTISRFDLRWDHLAGWHYTGQKNATQAQKPKPAREERRPTVWGAGGMLGIDTRAVRTNTPRLLCRRRQQNQRGPSPKGCGPLGEGASWGGCAMLGSWLG